MQEEDASDVTIISGDMALLKNSSGKALWSCWGMTQWQSLGVALWLCPGLNLQNKHTDKQKM